MNGDRGETKYEEHDELADIPYMQTRRYVKGYEAKKYLEKTNGHFKIFHKKDILP